MTPRRFFLILVVLAQAIMLAVIPAAPAGAQSSTCEMPDPAPELDPSLQGVYAAIDGISNGVLDLRTAIEAQTDFSPGWTETGDAATAQTAVNAALADLQTEMRAIADAWNLPFEPDQGGFGETTGPPPPAPFPGVLYDLSAMTGTFDFPDLDAQTTREDALSFWTNGLRNGDGGPCGWALTYVSFASFLVGGSAAAPGDLPNTGAESALLAVVGLAIAGAGGIVMIAGRRRRVL